MLLWGTHRRFVMFLPNLNSHSSNRLCLLLLSFVLLGAITVRPRNQRYVQSVSRFHSRSIYSRPTHLLRFHA
jgi:hypothetical protein